MRRPAKELATLVLLGGCMSLGVAVRAQDLPQEDPQAAIAEIVSPMKHAPKEIGTGKASWYGGALHGRRTANGERFDANGLTAAHRTLPFGTLVRVFNPNNGKEVVVRINDRGPRVRDRVIDLSKAAAKALGLLRAGEAQVVLTEH